MRHLFTLDELRRMEYACHISGRDDDLADKIRSLVDNEYMVHGSRRDVALTPVELVKQMILDSPLARVSDMGNTPRNVVNVAFGVKWLRRLIEAVESL